MKGHAIYYNFHGKLWKIYIYMTVYSITIFPIYKNEKIKQQESMINWKKKQ
jgi:hypothetical protein